MEAKVVALWKKSIKQKDISLESIFWISLTFRINKLYN